MVCSRNVPLEVKGTLSCYKINGEIKKDSVTATLKTKSSTVITSKSGLCGEPITLEAEVSLTTIRQNGFHVTFTYNTITFSFTKTIRKDCDNPRIDRRGKYFCNFDKSIKSYLRTACKSLIFCFAFNT
uniref:ZP domain-containing protein n=1 Tax=Strongyloides venezuelensis TaxID=75913 RepID=A0A0K0FDD4_STRVS